jgi:hypothetical protein
MSTGVRAAALALTLLLGGKAGATTVDQAYAAALKDYYAGRYEPAVEAFERVLAIPLEHPDVHYNLGCAYFRLGKLGYAIYHFERALLLDPGAEDAAFNLQTVRTMVAGKIKDELKGAAKDPFWVRAVSLTSQARWAVLFLVLWWLTLGTLFLLRYVSPGPARAGLVAANSFVALLALVGGLLLGGRLYLDERVTVGIVLPDRLAVREGPDATTKVTFRLHAGLRVRLQGGAGDWSRIRLANGLEGWVRKREVGVL